MQKIFSEIKKAIEEEMRNAEGAPPPGGQRQGGRRAQEYAEWLKQEQERLRDGRQSETLREVPVESDRPLSEQEWERQGSPEWEERPVRQPVQDRRPPTDRQSRRPERPARPQQRETSTSYQRSEARHARETAGAYDQPGARGSGLRRQVNSLLSSPHGLRQAFILREIVSKPVSLRDKDEHLIS